MTAICHYISISSDYITFHLILLVDYFRFHYIDDIFHITLRHSFTLMPLISHTLLIAIAITLMSLLLPIRHYAIDIAASLAAFAVLLFTIIR